MIHQCYYCEQIFNTKEKLYQHLEEHAKTKDEQEKEKPQNRLSTSLFFSAIEKYLNKETAAKTKKQ